MPTEKFKINDRVKRLKKPGCHGVVKDLRQEVSTNKADTREKALMVVVAWDNGTTSYFAPEALELA